MKKGFTLLELLIVIAIIAILSVALLPTITGAPAKARDAARVSAVESIVTVIEKIVLDGGSYPTSVAAGECLTNTANTAGAAINAKLPSGLPKGQNDNLITLCSNPKNGYFYKSFSGGGYMVVVQVEKEENGNHTKLVVGDFTTLKGLTDRASVSAKIGTASTGSPGEHVYIVVQ